MTVLTQEQLILQKIAEGETIVEAHIQEPITAYNLANGVKFSDAHNCETWSRDDAYEHQLFCIAVWKSDSRREDKEAGMKV